MTGTDAVRNIAFVGPNGSGKTTLLENLLYVAGAISRKGETTEGNTVGDASPEARTRQMGIEVNAVSFDYADLNFTILDCPGSIEFAQEARNALLGIDAAVVVVEPVPERMISIAPILNFLDKNNVPHLVFINKMDRSEVRFRDLLQSLRDVSDRPVIPHQYAIGRGEDLIGYIDLVTEKAYAYKAGAPAEPIELPEEYREREQAARQ
ncbi:MAG: GTP-binding protein, partial [Geminicoccaceae bacterium]